jgi:hypothetical protein
VKEPTVATFKNDTGDLDRDFPLYGLRRRTGETFEVPDEALSFEAQGVHPSRREDRRRRPPDPAVVEARRSPASRARSPAETTSPTNVCR